MFPRALKCICTPILLLVTHAHTHTHTRTHAHTHTRTHPHTHTPTHAHTHTRTHAHTLRLISSQIDIRFSVREYSANGDVPSNNGGNVASVAQTAATDGVGHRRLIVAASNSPETQDSLSPLEADSALTGFSLSSGEQALHFVRLLCSLPKQASAAAATDDGDPSMLLYSAQHGYGTGCNTPSNRSQSITSAHPPRDRNSPSASRGFTTINNDDGAT